MKPVLPARNEKIPDYWAEVGKKLKQYFKYRVSTLEDSEDLAQSVLVKAHEHIGDLKDDQKLESWIFSIARNTLTDFYRSKANSNNSQLEKQMQMEVEPELEPNEPLKGCFKGLIEALPEVYQAPLHLRESEGKSYQEIADILAIPLATSKTRIHRGRNLVREMILKCCHLELDRYGSIVDYTKKPGNCKICDAQNNGEKEGI